MRTSLTDVDAPRARMVATTQSSGWLTLRYTPRRPVADEDESATDFVSFDDIKSRVLSESGVFSTEGAT